MTSRPVHRKEIGGIPVVELARRFGTPTYVYDAAILLQRLDDLKSFDTIRYAQKACSNLAILDLLGRKGAVLDSVSAGEIRRALAAGFSPEGEPPAIVFTADIFDHEALDLCVEKNIHVNCGSEDMIRQLGVRAPGRDITLRLNPGFGHGHSQKTNTGGPQSKHGIWHDQLGDCIKTAAQYDLTVSGLHMHIGSGADMEHLSQVCGAMEKAALEAGDSVRSISTGGGLPIQYQADDEAIDVQAYYELWDATRKRLEQAFGHPVALEIEPGRYIAAESGYLVTEIRAVKRQADNLFYLVDAGFNNLARPIMYGSYHPISIAAGEGNPNDVASRPLQDVTIGGPLCESGDIFTQEEGGFVAKRALPESQVGDLLILECAGAYGVVMGSNYNSKTMAAEVLVDDGKAYEIRRRQSFEEMTACETIPDRE